MQKGKDGEADLFLGTIENHGIMDNVDATTNLYNIYEFWRYMKKAKEEKKDSYLLVLGVNNFSEVNDVYGYAFAFETFETSSWKLHRNCIRWYGEKDIFSVWMEFDLHAALRTKLWKK